MSKLHKLTIVVVSLAFFAACEQDDLVDTLPLRDRAVQQIADRDSLLSYLSSHYYNSGDLMALTNPSEADIVIESLPEDGNLPDPENQTLLIEAVEMHTTTYLDVEYEYYILRIRQGGGDERPHFSDDVRVQYSGSYFDGSIFDSRVNPEELDLTYLVPGWSRVLTQFNVAEGFTSNPDGTVTYTNPGVGVMFLPSGLAYFDGNGAIPPYTNLVFKFALFQMSINDHDADNIPSFLEDIDGDLNLASDDTDGDFNFNFNDADDDGDGVLTKDEDLEPDTDLTVDRDGDGDPTNDIGDGDPTNDDSDNDGIPNYLDPDSTGSRLD
jgi:hypothetical protein